MRKAKRGWHIGRPHSATKAADDYFASQARDFSLFHFFIDTVLVGDYAAHVASTALARIEDKTSPKLAFKSPVELAKSSTPGSRTVELRKKSQVYLELFLVRCVDNFNKYLVDLIREVLKKNPAILRSRQQTLTLEAILEHSSIDELVQSIIEAKVTALSYEGFESMAVWCNDRGIPLQVSDGKSQEVVQYIATRNLISHNRGIVDERFLRAVPNSKFKVGEVRELTVNDYEHCLDLLSNTVRATDDASARKFKLRRTRVSPRKDKGAPGKAMA
ncbi:MAG TPA: hypothetical protein VHA15_14920 [Burkholderiales bacterium]|nr:hypothetical protein [Burkholderiales bacterium]